MMAGGMARAWRATPRAALLVALYVALGFAARALEALAGRGLPASAVWEAARFGLVYVALPVFVVICVDLLVQRAGGPERIDYAYWPRPWRLRAAWNSLPARILLIVGALLIALYWLAGWQYMRDHPGRYGPFGSARIQYTVLLVWGILWLADALARPRRRTFGAALTYTLVCLFFAWAPALYVLWGCAAVSGLAWLLGSATWRWLRRRRIRGRGPSPEDDTAGGDPSSGRTRRGGLIVLAIAFWMAGTRLLGPPLLQQGAAAGHLWLVGPLLFVGVDPDRCSPIWSHGGKMTPLQAAVVGGHERVCRLLLSSGASPNATRNADAWSVLHTAASRGHESIVAALLDADADLNARDNRSQTPLYMAAAEGHVGTVRLLLERGADPNAVSFSGWTPLIAAAAQGSSGAVSLLVDYGADVNARKKDTGLTPLGAAAFFGPKDEIRNVVRALLEHGAQVDVKNRAGETPLFQAASAGDPDVVRMLLDHGARPDAQNDVGDGPLWWALMAGKEEAARILFQAASGPEFIGAVLFGDVQAVKGHLAREPAVLTRAYLGQAPLAWGVLRGSADVVAALLEAGADVNGRDRTGKTPMHLALAGGHLAVAKVLLKNGARMDIHDATGRTPMQVARSTEDLYSLYGRGSERH